MKKIAYSIVVLLCVLLFALSDSVKAAEETMTFQRFGTVTLYQPSPNPSRVVLFVSGDGGWNLGVIDMAKTLSSFDALVVGIDIRSYMKSLESDEGKCLYPASDFEGLSQSIQKKLNFPKYIPPVLVGYSSGATLVYAILVQAPAGTFQGALSLGFCPDLQLPKPLCHGQGLEWKTLPKGKGYSFLPANNLEVPWVALQGTVDQVCDPQGTEGYVRQVKRGEIIMLPKVGHGFAVQKNWMPQFKQAFNKLVSQPIQSSLAMSNDLKDLPIVEVPAQNPGADLFAAMISGDGGWAGLDKEVAGALSGKGIPVIGLSSIQYFWKARTPDEAGKDLERILTHYLSAWKQERILLIGYSLGADVLPFMASRLPQSLLSRIKAVILLAPSHDALFEFHITSNWLGLSAKGNSYPTLPEIEKLSEKMVDAEMLCVYGENESDTICKSVNQKRIKSLSLPGTHHFGGDYQAVASVILKEIE